jgi:hypothetical protein
MQVTRLAAALCALVNIPTYSSIAWADQPPLLGTAGKPPAASLYQGSWPVVLTPSVMADPSAAPPPEWSQQDVELARTRCAALLKGLDVVAVPADPIREGAACGTPAPMQLVSIGSNPQIAFSPPATITCDMIVALHKWLRHEVQPLARRHLGAPIVSVSTMSSFSCRNAYGRARTRLSEHGRANAVDIGTFLTAQGETTMVVADWGPNAREMAANAAEAQAEAVKRKAEAVATARKKKAPDEPRLAAPETVKTYQGTTIPIGIPSITVGTRPSSAPTDLSTGLGWAPPSRLGGPKDAESAAAASGRPAGKTAFLHAIHKAACGIFATVLGPEANRAHKNHFHLDLAERKSASICE